MIKTMDIELVPPMDSCSGVSRASTLRTLCTNHTTRPDCSSSLISRRPRRAPRKFSLCTCNVSVCPIAAHYIQRVLNKYGSVSVFVDTAAMVTQIAVVTSGNLIRALQGAVPDSNHPIAALHDAQEGFYRQVPGTFFEHGTACVFSKGGQGPGLGQRLVPLFDRPSIKTPSDDATGRR